MKTLKTIIASLLILSSFNTFADGTPAPENKNKRLTPLFLPFPEIAATPEDINSKTVESLKNIRLNQPDTDTAGANSGSTRSISSALESAVNFIISAPEMVWGSPEDVNSESVKALKNINFPAPDMNWGNPEDVNSESVNALKNVNFPVPDMNWGSPEDVNSESVKALKYVNFPAPDMNWGSPEDVNSESVQALKLK